MRDESIDRAKGILIFLVVLGHAVGMARNAFTEGQLAYVLLNHFFTAIYLFHMPAFFFLAGVGESLNGRRSGGLGEFAVKKARRLLVPYVTWGVASILVFLALRGCAELVTDQGGRYASLRLDGPWWRPFLSLLHAGGWPNGDGLVFNAVLWFLPVMFLTTVAYRLVVRMKGVSVFFVLFFALGEVIKFSSVRNWPLGMDRVPHYLAFMLLGALVGRRWQDAGEWLRTPTGAGLAWGVYLAVAWLWPDIGYRWQDEGWSLFGSAMAVFGTVLTLLTAKLLAERKLAGRFVLFGQASLTIMLAHKFLILPVQVALYRLTPQGGGGLGVGVVALIGAVALAYAITRVLGMRGSGRFMV